MTYINDPREQAIHIDSAQTLEQDSRQETMYHWGAMILDLCDLPVSEYMKPMTVIVSGTIPSESGNTSGETEDAAVTVNFCAQLFRNGSAVTAESTVDTTSGSNLSDETLNISPSNLNMEFASSNPIILGASTDVWKVIWRWNKNFEGSVKSTVSVSVGDEKRYVTAVLTDNDEKMYEELITLGTDETITNFSTYGIGDADKSEIDIDGVHEFSAKTNSTDYTFKISENTEDLKLAFKRILSGLVVDVETYFYKDIISAFSGSTDKDGFDFDGWFYSDGTSFVEGTAMPANDLTIYGKYTEKKFTVDFYLDDVLSKTISGISYNTVLKSNQFPATAKSGYRFLGWEPSSASPITADTIFNGSYERTTYTLTWNLQSGNTIETEELGYGDTINYSSHSTDYEGYTFTGWSTTANTMPAKALTITAKYKINSYKVTFYKGMPEGADYFVSSANVKYNAAFATPAIPSAVGYTYSTWTEEDGYSGTTMIARDLNYKSVPTVNKYVLSYFIDDAFAESALTEYKAVISPNEPVKTGYTFSGWATSDIDMSGNTMPAHDTSLYGWFNINHYTVKFYDGSVSDDNLVYTAYGIEYGKTAEEALESGFTQTEGYTYALSSEEGAKTIGDTTTAIIGTKTVNKHTLTISISGETDEAINDVEYGSNIQNILDGYAREGYTLVVKSGSTTTMPDKDLTIVIAYEPVKNKIIITYSGYAKAGKTISNVAYNTLVADSLPSDTAVTGYDFAWNYNGAEFDDSMKMPASDIEIQGVYSIKSYTLTIDVDGTKTTQEVEYGASIKGILDGMSVAKTGYTYKWYMNSAEVTSSTKMPASAATVMCKYTVNVHTLAFADNTDPANVKSIKSSNVAYGTLLAGYYPDITNSAYTDNGVEYVFKWETIATTTMPDSDLTIYGAYAAKPTADKVYYGAVVNDDVAGTLSRMSNFTLSEGTAGKSITIVLPEDTEYTAKLEELEEAGDEEAYEAYYESYNDEHKVKHCILMPQDCGYNLSVKDALSTTITFAKSSTTLTIEDAVYDVYTYESSKITGDNFGDWNYTVTLTK